VEAAVATAMDGLVSGEPQDALSQDAMAFTLHTELCVFRKISFFPNAVLNHQPCVCTSIPVSLIIDE
jgi:hypothetical protein